MILTLLLCNPKKIKMKKSVKISTYAIPGLKSYKYTEFELMKDVSSFFDVPEKDISGPKSKGFKLRNHSLPRQISMFLIKKYFPYLTFAYIGALFNRDHSTVIYATNTISNLIDVDLEIRKVVEDISGIINIKMNSKNERNVQQLRKGNLYTKQKIQSL